MTHLESVAKLHELIALPTNWDSYGAAPPNEQAVINTRFVLEFMDAHKLEADAVVPDANGGIALAWNSVFNVGHKAHIMCLNDGTVTACAWDDADDFKFWWIAEYIQVGSDSGFDCPDVGELQLTIQETMEYIRHYIWANHDTV